MSEILNINSISHFHEMLGLPVPQHPLISFIRPTEIGNQTLLNEQLFQRRYTADLYTILYKDKVAGSMGYGRNTYDFQEGTLLFLSPGQVYSSPSREASENNKGWILLFHPDLIRRSALGEQMHHYTFFSYDVNEALHLSPKEERFCLDLVLKIQEEYEQNIDQHSQTLIVSNLELFLNYCMRFYDRQFYTRSDINKDFVAEFELALKDYFHSTNIAENGLPSANYFGKQLNMSTNYLSDMLKKETGKGIKEHIDGYLVEKAKSILLNSDKNISEIAYTFGFDYPQSFTRLFKNKTGMSPAEYRKRN